jgi:hypothetical protein
VAFLPRGRRGNTFVPQMIGFPLVAFILLFILDTKQPIVLVAPPPKDPRWQNLRALQPDMAVAAAALQAAQEANKQGAIGARRRHQDCNEAHIGPSRARAYVYDCGGIFRNICPCRFFSGLS